MSLRTEIPPYIDGNGLVAPCLVPPNTLKGSDNGPMYTAELYVMYEKLGQLTDQDKLDYAQKIGQCVNSEGMLCRVPISQNDGQEQVDDYHGVLDGCMQMGNTKIPRRFLWALIKYLGFMDNVNPGSHSNWSAFMPRQIQLMACVMAASFPSCKNPLHVVIRLLCWPLFVFAAIIIATSSIDAPASNTDDRRLSWHLWQCTKPVSLLCWLAGKIWLKRLYKVYPNGMQGVAALYYQAGHPFIKYWVTE